jgi:hypothetical protein
MSHIFYEELLLRGLLSNRPVAPRREAAADEAAQAA